MEAFNALSGRSARSVIITLCATIPVMIVLSTTMPDAVRELVGEEGLRLFLYLSNSITFYGYNFMCFFHLLLDYLSEGLMNLAWKTNTPQLADFVFTCRHMGFTTINKIYQTHNIVFVVWAHKLKPQVIRLLGIDGTKKFEAFIAVIIVFAAVGWLTMFWVWLETLIVVAPLLISVARVPVILAFRFCWLFLKLHLMVFQWIYIWLYYMINWLRD